MEAKAMAPSVEDAAMTDPPQPDLEGLLSVEVLLSVDGLEVELSGVGVGVGAGVKLALVGVPSAWIGR